MPNLRQLEYLVAVADALNFRRAAEKTNATQPTLSEQLKALECRLGVQLVERTRTRVILTPIGTQIVGIARRMLADAEEMPCIGSEWRQKVDRSAASRTAADNRPLPPTARYT